MILLLGLTFVIGLFLLFCLVKMIGKEEECSTFPQLLFLGIVLLVIELSGNYLARLLLPKIPSLISMVAIFAGVGMFALIACILVLRLRFTTAFKIAFTFSVFKLVTAFVLGYVVFWTPDTRAKIVTLWEPNIRTPGVEKTHRDPRWNSYNIGNVSLQLPGDPQTNSQGKDSGPSKGLHSKFWKEVKFPKSKLRLDYWHYDNTEHPNPKESMKLATSRLLMLHPTAFVADTRDNFKMKDPSLKGKMYRVQLDDETVDLDPASVYILSVVRGKEEWMLEVSGNISEIEKLSQFTFPAFQPLTNAPPPHPKPGASSSSAYPLTRSLKNRQNGNVIEAQISGRTELQVIFTSKGKQFRYDINKLSDEDQKFLKQLPVTE